MYLICGLGNPGSKYEKNRHNLGFMVLNALARRCQVDFRSGRGNYLFAKTKICSEDVLLVKPMTFMNLSGDAVRHAVDYWKLDTLKVIIIFDDFAIPFGQIRIRTKGRDGGHNGVASVIQRLNTTEFSRIKMGIGSEFQMVNKVNFVLSNFSSEESRQLPEFIENGVDAAEKIIKSGVTTAMNEFNRKQ